MKKYMYIIVAHISDDSKDYSRYVLSEAWHDEDKATERLNEKRRENRLSCVAYSLQQVPVQDEA